MTICFLLEGIFETVLHYWAIFWSNLGNICDSFPFSFSLTLEPRAWLCYIQPDYVASFHDQLFAYNHGWVYSLYTDSINMSVFAITTSVTDWENAQLLFQVKPHVFLRHLLLLLPWPFYLQFACDIFPTFPIDQFAFSP